MMYLDRFSELKLRGHVVPVGLPIALFILFLVLIDHLLGFTTGGMTGEVQNDYFPCAQAMFTGHVPYVPYNDLGWEYPPLSYIFIMLPRLFSSDPWGYQIAFGVEMYLIVAATAVVICVLAKERGRSGNIEMAIFLILSLTMANFIFERFDLVPAALVALSFFFYSRKRYGLAFAILAIATAVKIYPGILFIVYLMPFIVRHDRSRLMRNAALFIITGIAVTIPFIVMAPHDFTSFITYHSNRGVQLESTAASLFLLAKILGLADLNVMYSYGSFDIVSSGADMISPAIMPLMIIAIIAVYCAQYITTGSSEEENDKSVAFYSLAVIAVFIVFNKVFSAQYMIWLVPLFAVFLIYAEEWERFVEATTILFCAMVLTFTFKDMFTEICMLKTIPVLTLVIRDAFMVVFVGYLFFARGMLTKNSIASAVCKAIFKEKHYRVLGHLGRQ
jgi:uncharacterized membrane protein